MEDLTCPVCWYVRHDCKIFQCQNGHLICEECYAKVHICPMCRIELQKPGHRNLYAEKSIKKLPLRCKYTEQGCSYKTPSAKEHQEHEAECLFRPLMCPGCGEESTFGLLLDHLKTVHRGTNKEEDAGGFVRCILAGEDDSDEGTFIMTIGEKILIAFITKESGGRRRIRVIRYGKATDQNPTEVLVTTVGRRGVMSVAVRVEGLESSEANGDAMQGVVIDPRQIGRPAARLSLSFALMRSQLDFERVARGMEESVTLHDQSVTRAPTRPRGRTGDGMYTHMLYI